MQIHPHDISEEFSQQHGHSRDPEVASEKTGSDGNGVSYSGQEREKGEPISVFLYSGGKAFKFFFFDAQVFFYPFQFT